MSAGVLAATLLWSVPGASPSSARKDQPDGRPAARRVGPSGPPGTAWSHYLTRTSRSELRALGCDAGERVARLGKLHDSIVILAFGRPVRKGSVYGASLFGDRFIGPEGVIRAAQSFVTGYASCLLPRTAAGLTLALGTSNYGSQVSYAHGRAWARMVNEMNEWLQEHGHWAIRAAGANDIELGWNSPRVSRRWVDGYDSAARWPFYNFGDAAACPPAGNCAGAWTMEDVWYVSWGARSAWPLPQIYNEGGTQAEQWYRLSLYAHRRHGQRMTIAGAISQREACRESSDPCRGINNSPTTAWRQLWRALNRDSRTAQPLRWSTDFRWTR